MVVKRPPGYKVAFAKTRWGTEDRNIRYIKVTHPDQSNVFIWFMSSRGLFFRSARRADLAYVRELIQYTPDKLANYQILGAGRGLETDATGVHRCITIEDVNTDT